MLQTTFLLFIIPCSSPLLHAARGVCEENNHVESWKPSVHSSSFFSVYKDFQLHVIIHLLLTIILTITVTSCFKYKSTWKATIHQLNHRSLRIFSSFTVQQFYPNNSFISYLTLLVITHTGAKEASHLWSWVPFGMQRMFDLPVGVYLYFVTHSE